MKKLGRSVLLANIRRDLIDAGVKNMRSYGYEGCTKDNLMTDGLFSKFFRAMLIETVANPPRHPNPAELQEVAKTMSEELSK